MHLQEQIDHKLRKV